MALYLHIIPFSDPNRLLTCGLGGFVVCSAVVLFLVGFGQVWATFGVSSQLVQIDRILFVLASHPYQMASHLHDNPFLAPIDSLLAVWGAPWFVLQLGTFW